MLDTPAIAALPLASLMPSDWFADLQTWVLVALAVVCMAVVIFGAEWLVDAAASIAKKLGMPEVIIGATIVSLGTTAPETAVSVLAAFSGNAGLALGNGVGSIIADTGLIFGVGLLLTRLPADQFVLNRQGWVQFGSAVMLAAICYGLFATQRDDATLPRAVGVGFLVLLVGYLCISIKWARQHPSGEPHLIAEDDGTVAAEGGHAHAERPLALLLGMGLAGLSLVIFGGDALVQSVTVVAERSGVPDQVIAATFVALGTSLPELVVGITAIRKGHAELLVGNVIGADILNVLFVIGAASLAAPLPIVEATPTGPSYTFLMLQLPVMLGMLLLMRVYIFKACKTGSFDRWMGVPLVLAYVGFIAGSFLLS